MTSTRKSATAKRAELPRRFEYAKGFLKDWERLSHSGRHDMHRLKTAMQLLSANDAPMPAEWRDHDLSGDLADHRECHVKGDLLLVYRIQGDTVTFVRAGTHTELFGS